MTKPFVSHRDIMALGFKEHTARDIIRQAKQFMVQRGNKTYENSRLGHVPQFAVFNVLGANLDGDEYIGKD